MHRYRILLTGLLTLLWAGTVTPRPARFSVPPFAVSSVRSFPDLGPRLARLLAFRLSLFPGIRIRSARTPGATYRVAGQVRIRRFRLEYRALLYRKGDRFPVARVSLRGKGPVDLYRFTEHTALEFASIPRSQPIHHRAPTALDLAFCVNLSGSMSPLMHDLPRAFLETLNTLERTVPFAGYRVGLLLYRGGRVVKTIGFTRNRYRLLKTLGRPSAWSPPGETRGTVSALRAAARLPWRSDAARVLVLYSNRSGTGFASGIARLLSLRKIRLLHVIAPGGGKGSLSEKRALKVLAAATGGRSVAPPVLAGWDLNGKGSSLLWDRGRVFLFRRRVRPAAIPFLRPESYRLPHQSRIYRAETLAQALSIARSPHRPDLSVGLARAVHRGLARILPKEGIRLPRDRIAGRLLLESGGQRFWWDTTDPAFFNKVKRYRGGKKTFWLGIHPIPAPHRKLNFTAHPGLFHLPPPGTYIPELAQAGIERISAKPAFYTETGTGSPPRWYLRVRLLRVTGGERPLSEQDH